VGRQLDVPEGFAIELVAGPPLVERPITATFDNLGRLYVGDSSGSNEPVETQLKERPHRIVRLEDIDGDGHFDSSVVFADRMMFPEGTLFYKGSLYVAAPPSIWKLTDTNDDGIADVREEWFQGKTLTHCANDLHGPYLGPDGFIYWCKGAFGEQIHEVNGRQWKTRAAHIFRCRPDGTGLEPVMTGGMDNPVDVAFSSIGERFFTATFLVHPGGGKRDGLAHAVYGGVHGKDHGVITDHPQTGPLMPIINHMGAAAPCGLERYEYDAWGDEYRDCLFACQFNLRKVSRHVLHPVGADYHTDSQDFVTSDDVDFHPTDVIADADASLLIIDTGGWYKLCCPTSQLAKADVLGAIYRVRKLGAKAPRDPRGRQIQWSELSVQQVWELLADERPTVRVQATVELTDRQSRGELAPLLDALASEADAGLGEERTGALARAWALGQINSSSALSLTRKLLRHAHHDVRHVAAQVVSLVRDRLAYGQLIGMLRNDTTANRRIAAEALGRTQIQAGIPHLLAAAATTDDRILRHSIIFALIELADADQVRLGVASNEPGTRAAALIALDQMAADALRPGDVIPALDSTEPVLRDTALWLVARHPEWGDKLADWFRARLGDETGLLAMQGSTDPATKLDSLLVVFASHPAVQQLMADAVVASNLSTATRERVLRAMSRARPTTTPPAWLDVLARLIDQADLISPAISTVRALSPPDGSHAALDRALLKTADDEDVPREIRVAALAAVSARLSGLSSQRFDLLVACLTNGDSVDVRSAAVDALAAARLSPDQLGGVCALIETARPLEVNQLLEPFIHSQDERVGLQLISSLKRSPALPALQIDVLRDKLAGYGSVVEQGTEELHALLNVDLDFQRKRIAELLPALEQGDIRRGHAVYHSAKALCSACHQLGYAGGTSGPDLSRIGEVRTKRDLLESIVFPSLSFVRSFEPVVVVTTNGQSFNGVMRDRSDTEILLATGPDKEVRLPMDHIDVLEPSRVSIMPAGIDEQLTLQELADLVAFLKSLGQ
jgi:putative membrane-bound dehydrogenase-like protein